MSRSSHEPSQLKPGGPLCTRLPWRTHLGCWWEGLLQHSYPTHTLSPSLGAYTCGSINFPPSRGTEEKGFGGLCLKLHPGIINSQLPTGPQASSMAKECSDNMMNITQTPDLGAEATGPVSRRQWCGPPAPSQGLEVC